MPTKRIPLLGAANPRTIDGDAQIVAGRDQRFINCTFSVVQEPGTGPIAYVEKRPGWTAANIVSAGEPSTGHIAVDWLNSPLSAFGTTNSTIYEGTTSVGAITGRALFFTETLISGVGYITIKSSDGTGWYYVDGARSQTSYTGNTNTNTTVNSIASTAGMYAGQAISGTDIPAGTRIASVDSGTAITLTAAATGTTVGVTLTKTPIAKMLDADFVTTGTFISRFVDMDGYLVYSTDNGYLRNSDLNSVTAYSATNAIAVQMSPDKPVAVMRSKHQILCFGTDSIETYRNAGNPSGSPFNRVADVNTKVGALDQRSICEVEDDIFFVNSSRDGDLMIRKIPGMDIVSTPAITKQIGTISSDAKIYLSGFGLGGYRYVSAYITSGTSGSSALLLESGDYLLLETGDRILLESSDSETAQFTRHFVYNAELKLWSEWDSNIPTFITGNGGTPTNQLLATSRVNTGGKIYTINPSADGEVHTDDGSAFTMSITTIRIDFGTNKRKFIDAIRLIGDTQSEGTASISWSDDDYATFSTARTFDMTAMQPEVTRCGSHKGGRVYKITHSANTPFRAQALEIDYRVGQA